ncbi:AMP-binding protein [Opitutales bacterium]|nr:AMP-binding protein [Opitutales bacterium]
MPKKRVFRKGVILALSLILSQRIRNKFSDERVGVLLPPGVAGFISNFALFLSDLVPVNLNFTLGEEINREILNSAGIRTVITAKSMIEKFPNYPWPENCFCVGEFLDEIADNRWMVVRTCLLLWIFPKRACEKFQIPTIGEDKIAILLYTSGSSGKPKGVPLSHENLLENCRQLQELELFRDEPKVLVNLPLFHSFGMTVGMLFSTLRGLPVVTTPSPLDYRLNIRAISQQKVGVLLGTPTFLRGYLKKSVHGELASIRYVVAGAEKSPASFRNLWEKKMNCEYLEGYGLTETSPALSFNQPGEGKRCGSVGRLLKGVECRTIDPESGDITPLAEGGILCFRGPNIFAGYWQDAEHSNKVLDENGWFKTGDLGRLDRDGFLWIEGRSSRFSKIGGEMVPHGRVEEEITELLEICQSEGPKLVVCSVENDQKGEILIVVSSFNCDLNQIKKGLKIRGLPNLWIPKELLLVKEIPILPTGKINWLKVRSFVTSRIKG